MKVVLDSSVLFSALLKASGATKALFDHARQGRFQLCLSETILEETADSLLRKVGQFDYSESDVIEYIALLTAVATVVDELPEIPPVCRDPDDDHILAAAVAAGAEVIVTGDDDLLTLRQYEGIRILTVRAFLEELAE